jgi:hypothetical protein
MSEKMALREGMGSLNLAENNHLVVQAGRKKPHIGRSPK